MERSSPITERLVREEHHRGRRSADGDGREGTDAMIRRRDERRRTEEGDRAAQEMYEESVARYNAHQRATNRAAWAAYHESQAERHRRTLEALKAHHEGEAQKLLEDNEAKGA
jgi:hypothetical protein